jgi:hypothetical protein
MAEADRRLERRVAARCPVEEVVLLRMAAARTSEEAAPVARPASDHPMSPGLTKG